MERIHLHSFKHLKEKRTALRRNLTPAEALLWKRLKNKQFQNRRFRKQHSILNYIVDFYCPEEKLIIELDGNHHKEAEYLERDEERDRILSSLGFKTLRFENELVIQKIEEVLTIITAAFKES